ncbi:hypothetical protein ACFX5K_06145 [Rickettsiales bacterium LUAb2]
MNPTIMQTNNVTKASIEAYNRLSAMIKPLDVLTVKDNAYLVQNMKNNVIQLACCIPIFAVGMAKSLLAKYGTPNIYGIKSVLEYLRPLTENELAMAKKHFPGKTKIIGYLENFGYLVDGATAAFYGYRVINLHLNIGNVEVANKDMEYSWWTTYMSIVGSIIRLFGDAIQRFLLNNHIKNNSNMPAETTSSNNAVIIPVIGEPLNANNPKVVEDILTKRRTKVNTAELSSEAQPNNSTVPNMEMNIVITKL